MLCVEAVGVICAVLLTELGGIHQLKECNNFIGRSDWYLRLQIEHNQRLDIVDTIICVMPGKITNKSHRRNYNYIIVLSNSEWCLA
ncbi:hypothetical protein [Candidatus Enterovibrio altilux]|uniref:hypothetical protein n=1 Tax=Candidatus Enterovibrio altilux TaxID=1927128 RepID=UPI001237CBDC|nr:hypothetical protein [Candidatus Enterovibrio luxaltus]